MSLHKPMEAFVSNWRLLQVTKGFCERLKAFVSLHEPLEAFVTHWQADARADSGAYLWTGFSPGWER